MKHKKVVGSLVAFVVCVSSSFAEPQTLEEAIKGVKVDGFLRYRYNDVRFENVGFNNGQNVTGSGSQPPGENKKGAAHNWRADVNLSTPALYGVNLNLGVTYGNSNSTNVGGYGGYGLGSGADGVFGVSTFYATVAPGGTKTTIDAGKMRLNTPINDTLDDRGTGVMIVNQDVPYASLYAAIFDSWSLDDGVQNMPQGQNSITKEFHALGVQANHAGFAAHLMYAGVQDLFKYLVYTDVGYTTSLPANYPNFHIKAQYAVSQLSDKMLTSFAPGTMVHKNHSLLTVDAGVKMSFVGLRAGYITSGGDGYKVSLDDQGAYSMAGQLWNGSSILGISYGPLGYPPSSKEKLSVYYASLGLQFLENDALRVSVDYVGGEKKNKTINETIKFSEITPLIAYQYSPKMELRAYYAMITAKKDPSSGVANYADATQNRFRAQMLYRF